MSAVFAILVAALAQVPDSVEAWFPRLEAPSWTEREAAERRLAGVLAPRDAPAIRAALAAGGAETRVRLAHVLGSVDRLFGVAAELARDAEPEVARAALDGLNLAIERYEPRSLGLAIARDELWTALAEHDGAVFDARAPVPFEPAELADLLALAQPTAPRIVLERADAQGPGTRRAVEAGAWRELARHVAQRAGGRLVGFGVRREVGPHVVRWVAVVDRQVEESQLHAGDLVERWCLDFAHAPEPRARARAARTLARLGLPPAIAWLERRFRDGADEAAFEGLLAAARRAAPPAVLQAEFARDRLWSEIEGGKPLAFEAALALSGIGAPRGAGAQAELARAFAHLESGHLDRAQLDPALRERAELVLVALEGWAESGAPRGLESALRTLLARTDLAPATRLAALRVAHRAGVVEPLAGDPLTFTAAVLRAGRGQELAGLLRGAPGWPPDAWAAARRPDFEPAFELLLIEAWLTRGAVDPAAGVLARLLATHPAASEILRDFRVGRDRLRAALERGVSDQPFATRSVAAGVATEAERAERLVAFLAEAPSSELGWFALADLAAGSTGEVARPRIASLLATLEPEFALEVASRAVRVLRADLDDAGERAFLQAVRGAVRAERGGPLDRAFGPSSWPPPPLAIPPALLDLDRSPVRAPR